MACNISGTLALTLPRMARNAWGFAKRMLTNVSSSKTASLPICLKILITGSHDVYHFDLYRFGPCAGGL